VYRFVTSKTVGDQSVHRLGGGWMTLGELRLNRDVDGRMQLRTSGVVLQAPVVPPNGGNAICFGRSQPLTWVRRGLWVVSHRMSYRSV
jgi:hypothetical protein